MLSTHHELTISFFDVGGGDAIWIRFLGNDNNWHNVLIDGGYGRYYKNVFGPIIVEIISKAECIDLWIVTHIDLDHIGAMMGFLRDKRIQDKKAAIKEFWFNHPIFPLQDVSNKIAVGQGIRLRDYLVSNSQVMPEVITTDTAPRNYHGLTLKVVSPTPQKQTLANEIWKEREKGGKIGRSSEQSDYKRRIEDLASQEFVEDNDLTNGSSVALLMEYKHISGLFLSDSHPSDVTALLKKWSYSQSNPLQVDFVQVAHHGSKANTSAELLELIDTSQYIITGNGIMNRHPDKATLARMLTNKNRGTEEIKLIFTSNTREIRSIFEADEQPENRFNFSSVYPDKDTNYIRLNFISISENGNL